MKPLAPTDFRAFLQRLGRAFASKENTILAQILILTLVNDDLRRRGVARRVVALALADPPPLRARRGLQPSIA